MLLEPNTGTPRSTEQTMMGHLYASTATRDVVPNKPCAFVNFYFQVCVSNSQAQKTWPRLVHWLKPLS